MSLQLLTKASCLQPGSEVWILPPPNHSSLAAQTDWYLNFQGLKATDKVIPSVPKPLQDIVEAENLKFLTDTTYTKTPILIAAGSRLPTNWICYVEEGPEFFSTALEIWKNLKEPQLRIFLPNGVSVQDAKRFFAKEFESSSKTLTLVTAGDTADPF